MRDCGSTLPGRPTAPVGRSFRRPEGSGQGAEKKSAREHKSDSDGLPRHKSDTEGGDWPDGGGFPGEQALAVFGREIELSWVPCVRLWLPLVFDLAWPRDAAGSRATMPAVLRSLRRNHPRLQVEERHELVMILRHAAADDEKIGERASRRGSSSAEGASPHSPAEGPEGSSPEGALSVVTIDLKVPEFRIRNEVPVHDERGTDAVPSVVR